MFIHIGKYFLSKLQNECYSLNVEVGLPHNVTQKGDPTAINNYGPISMTEILQLYKE